MEVFFLVIPRRNVSVHPNYFGNLKEGSPEHASLLNIAKDFAQYWREGYHPDFGRDKPLERPDDVKEAGLCKVHVLLFELSPENKIFWDSKSLASRGPYYRSHSQECDSFLLYAVSSQGTALVLALYDQEGHKLLKRPHYPTLIGLAESAKVFFSSRGETPAPEEDLLNFLKTPTA